ncbi:MAG: GatB/YqeY domain-containing protein [Pseudomonadota bacterium]
MSIRDDLSTSLKEALKNKDQVSMSTIRLITAAIKDRDIAARSNGNSEGIGEPEILSLLQSMVKQRQESSKTYRDADREELAEREEQEITVIEKFLPQQMSEDDMSKAIEEIIAEVGAQDIKDMGKVMGELKSRYAGQLDMAKAGGAVKAKLAG